MDRLERMLERSKSCDVTSNDGIFVRVNFIYGSNSLEKQESPKTKFEKYLLSNLGQKLFNKYSKNEIDEDLREKVNELKRIYYVPKYNNINGRAKFIS